MNSLDYYSLVLRNNPAAPDQIRTMKRAAKIDINQPEIVAAFRKVGFSVCVTSSQGKGFPDIVIGYESATKGRQTALIEIKNGLLPPSKRRLTEDEQRFHDNWKGEIFIIESVDQALELANELRMR